MTAFSWTALSQSQYDTAVFNIVSSVEGVKDAPYLDSVGIPTIGIGFNLRANFTAIVNQIMYPDGVPASPIAGDAAYRSNLQSIVNQTWSSDSVLQSALNAVMQQRANDPSIDYANISIKFSNKNVVTEKAHVNKECDGFLGRNYKNGEHLYSV